MQNRMAVRDLIIYGLLLVVIILLFLLMYQVDRQWNKLDEMQVALSEQAQDMRSLRQRVVSGKVSTTASVAANGAFERAEAATQHTDYAQGDWLVNSFGNNLKTLTPLVSADVYASEVQSYVFESLLKRDPDTLQWQGFIAKDWQVSEDGLTITFTLRDDVTFSDGTPLTAEDVAFSYQFIMTEAIDAGRLRAYFDKIASVTATDQFTVVFTYKEPYFEALQLAGGMDILPKHFYASYLEEPQKFNESKALLLGSGPYRLANPSAWSPDQNVVELVRNNRYWGDVQPSFDRIMWRIIKNDSARLTTYRNGEIDAYSAKAKEYQQLKKDEQIQEKSQLFEYMPPVAGYSYIGWNQLRDGKATPFADKRVRQAMTYLTDRERIIQDIHLGYAELAVSPFSPRSKQHDPELAGRTYDLEKAKALLADAGFSDKNGDGVLDDAEGNSFEFKLIYFQDNDDTKRIVLLLKDLYAQAGVRLVPSPQEWPVMLEKLDKKDYDAITLGWSSGIETDIFQMFHSSQAGAKGDNFISYKNPELDALIDQARSTVEESQRMPLWQQAEKLMYEDQPYTFLFRRKALRFIDKRIQNLQMTKVGLNDSILPLETYIPKTLQRYQP